MKKPFTLFKKLVPTIMLVAAPNAFAELIVTDCSSLDSRFALMTTNVTFQAGQKYAFFDYTKINGLEYWGGQGSMMGEGTITATDLHLNLTWTSTGSSDKHAVGRLDGEFVQGEWKLRITPWDSILERYDSKKVSELTFCSSKKI